MKPSNSSLSELPPWAREEADGLLLKVIVVPGAKRNAFVAVHDNALKITLQAPPVDGKANEALCAYIAEQAKVKERLVRIVQGSTSRRKGVKIIGDPHSLLTSLQKVFSNSC